MERLLLFYVVVCRAYTVSAEHLSMSDVARDSICFVSSLRCRHWSTEVHEIKVKDQLKSINNIEPIERDYFIREALFVDLAPAAKILTKEFYSQKTNFITFQIEKLKTTLSLESTFPNQSPNSLNNNKYARRSLQQMIVACNSKDGTVVGFAEVDARPLGKGDDGTTIISDTIPEATVALNNNILRSYMYNLAVDKKWKRKGIASALVDACEQYVSDMHETCIEKRLYLRVRKTNKEAIALYKNLGYKDIDPRSIDLSKEDINSGSLEEGELILFCKDLPLDDECGIDNE